VKRRTRDSIVQSLLQPAQLATPRQARRVRLDASAEERVAASVSQAYRATVRPLPAGIVCAAVAGAALALTGSDLVLVAIAVPLACVAGYGVASMVNRTAARSSAKSELELAAAFDRLVEAAGELPASALERLKRVKELLPGLICAPLPADDAFFVRQAVARYLPDALAPYLALPAARRAGQEGLLDGQLKMIEDKLAALAETAHQAQLERLRQNRSFLERKLR
jgi:hypothetical protein